MHSSERICLVIDGGLRSSELLLAVLVLIVFIAVDIRYFSKFV